MSPSAKDVEDIIGGRLTKKDLKIILLFVLEVPFCFFLTQVTETVSSNY